MQDYKFVTRSVWGGANQFTPDGALLLQNAEEFMQYLTSMYLDAGYEIMQVDYLGEFVSAQGDPNSPRGHSYTWHLRKLIDSTSKKKVDDK